MMDHDDELSQAVSYLIRKGLLTRCEYHGEVHDAGKLYLDKEFWPIAMADRNRGANGPVPWAAEFASKEYTDLLTRAYQEHCGDECGFCADHRAD